MVLYLYRHLNLITFVFYQKLSILKYAPLKAFITKYCYWFLVFLFTSTISHAQSFNYERDYNSILKQTQTKGDSLNYNRLLPRFLNNDKSLTVFQILALMIGYSGLPEYKPFDDLKTEHTILHLNDSAKYEVAIHLCDSFLHHHPLNQLAIIEKAYAYYKLKKNDSAAYYKKQFANIMAAMDWSGDGRSADKAMFALGLEDGKNFADKYYHADVGETKTVIDKYGNYCSAVKMNYKKDGKTDSMVFYFVLQHAANTTTEKKVNNKP